jgi:hypothetical protein
MKKEPNIFEFATGELSQDAFICWLVSWLDYGEEHELKSAAKEFVALLCRIGGANKDVKSVNIGGLVKVGNFEEKVRRQYGKMDVFFIVDVSGMQTCFIIEDKTNSFPHSEQLKKYDEFVKKKHKSLPIMKIYFKTGYIFEKDELGCKEHGYGILDYTGIYEFLERVSTDNLVFNSYREYIRKNFYDEYEAGLSALHAGNGCQYLEKGYFQYEFMKRLLESCPAAIGVQVVNHGTSRGRPWTQFKFASAVNIYGEKTESIFYRIDRRKNKDTSCGGYFLSIRQYADIKGMGKEHKSEKLKRLKQYKEVFNSVSDSGIRFGKPVGDKTGKNSSEIAVLFFDEEVNTLQSVKEKLPLFHEKFVQSLRGSSLFG